MYSTKNNLTSTTKFILKKLPFVLFDILFVAALILLIGITVRAQETTDTSSTSSQLTLTVTTDKTSYDEGDNVEITLEAENVLESQEDVNLYFTSGCQMSFTVYQYVPATEAYTLPVYNETLYPRNCDATPTQLTIPWQKKAIWTRTLDPESENYPLLVPGEYKVHAFISDHEDDLSLYQNSSYVEFSVDPPEGEPLVYDDPNLTEELCSNTGGEFDGDVCTCDSSEEWSDVVGCTNLLAQDELCVDSSGTLPEDENLKCFCGDDYSYDDEKGCVDSSGNPINTLPEGELPFNDIEGHWAVEYIVALSEKGVVSGYEDGGFHPNSNINRAEMVKMGLGAAGISQAEPTGDTEFIFNDLDEWQIPWVYAAWQNDIVQGYDEYTFAPAKDVTRAEALKIALLAFNVEIPDTSDQWAFEDTVDHWAISYINQAYLDFIVSGRADGLFHPNDPITRAETAKIIQLLSEK